MQPLIIGLDPGTTSAYAILDISGDIIKVRSRRNMKLSVMIKDIIKYGKPLLAGTDKEKIPRTIKKFSLLTGAKIVSPEEDISVTQKKVPIKTKNEHETDALSSAYFAYDKYKSKFKRIRNYLIKKDKIELLDDVITLVISEEISKHKALKAIKQ